MRVCLRSEMTLSRGGLLAGALALAVLAGAILLVLLHRPTASEAPQIPYPYVAEKADELGDDPEAIVQFVRREIADEEYEGLLRGPVGTLWSHAGNPVDKATLAKALLDETAVESRLVQGGRDWWVEYRAGDEWVLADVTTSVKRGPVGVRASTVPRHLRHRLHFEVVSTLSDSVVETVSAGLDVADLVGRRVSIGYQESEEKVVPALTIGNETVMGEAGLQIADRVVARIVYRSPEGRQVFEREIFHEANEGLVGAWTYDLRDKHTFVVLPGFVPREVLRTERAEIRELLGATTNSAVDAQAIVNMNFRLAVTHAQASDAHAANLERELRANAYFREPRIIVVSKQFLPWRGETQRAEYSIDLLRNRIYVEGENARAFNVARGAYEIFTEGRILDALFRKDDFAKVVTAGSVFNRVMSLSPGESASRQSRLALFEQAIAKYLSAGSDLTEITFVGSDGQTVREERILLGALPSRFADELVLRLPFRFGKKAQRLMRSEIGAVEISNGEVLLKPEASSDPHQLAALVEGIFIGVLGLPPDYLGRVKVSLAPDAEPVTVTDGSVLRYRISGRSRGDLVGSLDVAPLERRVEWTSPVAEAERTSELDNAALRSSREVFSLRELLTPGGNRATFPWLGRELVTELVHAGVAEGKRAGSYEDVQLELEKIEKVVVNVNGRARSVRAATFITDSRDRIVVALGDGDALVLRVTSEAGSLELVEASEPVSVTVVDADSGGPVPGVSLTLGEFALRDIAWGDGVVRIVPPLSGAHRKSLLFVVDVSGSMEEALRGEPAKRRIDAARDAALALLDELPADVAVGLMTFTDVPNLVQDVTVDRDAIRTALRELSPDPISGGTDITEVVGDALEHMQEFASGSRGKIVLITDGDSKSAESPLRLLASAPLRLQFDAIGVDATFRATSDALLREIARATGGSYVPVSESATFTSALLRLGKPLVTEASGRITLALEAPDYASATRVVDARRLADDLAAIELRSNRASTSEDGALVWVSADDLEALEEVELTEKAKAWIAASLRAERKKLVVVPRRRVDHGLTLASGWLEIDPETGELVGVTEDGLHGGTLGGYGRSLTMAYIDNLVPPNLLVLPGAISGGYVYSAGVIDVIGEAADLSPRGWSEYANRYAWSFSLRWLSEISEKSTGFHGRADFKVGFVLGMCAAAKGIFGSLGGLPKEAEAEFDKIAKNVAEKITTEVVKQVNKVVLDDRFSVRKEAADAIKKEVQHYVGDVEADAIAKKVTDAMPEPITGPPSDVLERILRKPLENAVSVALKAICR